MKAFFLFVKLIGLVDGSYGMGSRDYGVCLKIRFLIKIIKTYVGYH